MTRYYIKKIECCEECLLRFFSVSHSHCSGKEGFRENFLPDPYLGKTTPPDWCPLPQTLVVEETKGGKTK